MATMISLNFPSPPVLAWVSSGPCTVDCLASFCSLELTDVNSVENFVSLRNKNLKYYSP